MAQLAIRQFKMSTTQEDSAYEETQPTGTVVEIPPDAVGEADSNQGLIVNPIPVQTGSTLIEENTSERMATGETSKLPKVRVSGRERHFTQKGLEVQIGQRQRAFRSAVSCWRGTVAELEVKVAEAENKECLRTLRHDAETAVNSVYEAYQELEILAPNDANFEKLDSIQEQYSNLGIRIAERLRDIMAEVRSNRSGIGNQSKGSRGSDGSHQSSRVNAVAEAASLQAKLKTLQAENAKRAEIAKLNGELEELRTRRELEVARATLQAIEEEREEQGGRNSVVDMDKEDMTSVDIVKNYLESMEMPEPSAMQSEPTSGRPKTPLQTKSADKVLQDKPASNLNPEAESFIMQSPSKSSGQELVDAMKSFMEQISLSRLPPPEPSIFYGDPIKFPGWKTAFQTLITSRGIPPSERLYYLVKYLAGEAKEAVEGFLLVSDDNAFERAKELLKKRYSDSFLIANAFRDKLTDWPRIQARDGTGLQKFADFLRQCLSAMSSVEGLSILDDSRENQRLAAKLPEWLLNKWARVVADIRRSTGRYPPFATFVALIEREAEIANDPILSVRGIRGRDKNADGNEAIKFTKDRKGIRCLSTHQTAADKTEKRQKGQDDPNPTTCFFCERHGHDLDSCRNFMKKPMDERRDYLLKKSLCFSCLVRGHLAKTCKQRKKCKTCQKTHPTVLHRDVPRSTERTVAETSISHLAGSEGGSKSTMILPVWVYHESDKANKKLV